MINHPAFTVEPWCLRVTDLDAGVLAQTESLFALSNGHVGWRGNLDEGEPNGLPGCYLNGVYELRPLPYAETAYGFPESGQSMINVTNGKLIRLLVDDEPFDVRYGRLQTHQQCLDFRAGVLQRTADWVSPAGRAVQVTSTRLVSFTQRAIAAICYQVQAGDQPVRIVLQSELVANEALPLREGDPRVAAALTAPLVPQSHSAGGARAALVHSTRRSGLRVAVVMDHLIDGPPGTTAVAESFPDLGRVTVSTTLAPGQRLQLVKFVAHGWSATRSAAAVADQADAALVGAMRTGWDALLAQQRTYLDDFWHCGDVQLEGDPQIQQAARFALFHVLQAGARAEDRPIPAKGLTGDGYDGHCFWDTETFVLPVLTYTAPQAVAQALRWRHATLPLAMQRARQLGLSGAAFPWRTVHGEECSGYWPAGTAAFHVGADITAAVIGYVHASKDDRFEREVGVDLLVQTARLWQSLGHRDGQGRFRIDGVTGPDEYSALADNNVYTNLMAQQNLQAAAAAVDRHPDRAADLGVEATETARWRSSAQAMFIPYDQVLGVHPQNEGFTAHQVWDFAGTTEQQYPLMLHFHYFDLYRSQVIKQADLVLSMQLCPDAFTAEQKARNFHYYEQLTVRDSSLSAGSQAVLAAEVGHLGLAHDYLGEAALMDLEDLEHNTRDGLHIASLAGVWTALVAGYGGMRPHGDTLRFAPRLPAGLTRLAFGVQFAGRRLRVEITPEAASYVLLQGPPLALLHHGRPITASVKDPVRFPIPALAAGVSPTQPHGRVPARRLPGALGAPPAGDADPPMPPVPGPGSPPPRTAPPTAAVIAPRPAHPRITSGRGTGDR